MGAFEFLMVWGVVVAVIAFTQSGSGNTSSDSHYKDRPWSEVKREIDEYERQLEEDRRYQKWLKEHQQPES